MADIKQAAKWMQEGKRVQRTSRKLWWLRMVRWSGRMMLKTNAGRNPELDGDDLLADDWEIADDK